MKKQEAILLELQDILGERVDWGDYPQSGIPDGYFTSLPSRIIKNLKQEAPDDEVEDIEALLPKSAGMPYELPENYFDELPANIIAKLKQEEIPAKVISIKKKRKSWKYLAAAVIAALIISSITLFSPHHQQTLEEQLNHIPEQEIEAYLQSNTDAFDQESIFKNVNLSNKSILSSVGNQLSPEAIKKYLEENGGLNNFSLKN